MQQQEEQIRMQKNRHKKCSVRGCTTEGGRMFAFPKGERCSQWLQACGKPELSALPFGKLKSRTVCELHFEPRYILAKKLSQSAVPTRHLPEPAACTVTQKEESNAMEVAEEEGHQPQCTVGLEDVAGDFQGSSAIVGLTECTAIPGSSRGLTPTIEKGLSLQHDNPSQSTEGAVESSDYHAAAPRGNKGSVLKLLNNSTLKRPLRQNVYNAVAALVAEAKWCKRRRLGMEQRVEKIERLVRVGVCKVLENLPTPLYKMIVGQMRNVGKPIHRRRFTEHDKVLALGIYKQNPKAFRYLSKLFVLPSIEMLRKLISRIPLTAGICDNVFVALKEQFDFPPNENSLYAVLMFDEFKLSPSLVYDPSMDRVEGFVDTGFSRHLDIADHATVWMLKGVDGVRPWTQPVAYTYRRGTSSAEDIVRILKELIRRAFQASVIIVATVCDQSVANCRAIECLITESKRNASQHGDTLEHDIIVIDDNKIVPLFDPPHLMKCMRNQLLSKDLQFTSTDNVPRVAKWSHVEDVYFIDNSDVLERNCVLRKLTPQHVVKDKIRKTKLKYCTQVFSQRVGALMTLMSRHKVKSVCGTRQMQLEGVDTAQFIHLMNGLFDSVNNKTIHKTRDITSETPDIWDKAISCFTSMRFIKRKPEDKQHPRVLQNWIRTIKNFKLLRSYLYDFGISHFVGRNFNLDSLANFFKQTRQHGTRNTNPTCSTFYSYYRTVLLNSYTQLVCADTKCKYKESTGFQMSVQQFLLATPSVSTNEESHISLNYPVPVTSESTVPAVTEYVLRCVNKKNITCKFCLELVYTFHEFETKCSSIQPACELLIHRVVSACLANVFNVAYTRNLVATITAFISEHENFEFTCSEHGNFLTRYIIRHCVLYVVKNYIERVNRVINGSEVPTQSDPLITLALQISKK